MMNGLIKMCASIALGYAGKTAAWAMSLINDKTKDKAYTAKVLEAISGISAVAESVANAMKDGNITEEESAHVSALVQERADAIKELL